MGISQLASGLRVLWGCTQAARWFICAILSFALLGHAQFPPPISNDGMTTIQSPVDGNITISYKTPPVGTCTTVFSTQKQYSGYITLPPNVLSPSQGNYTINTFFWFFEARQLPESAPLTIYINGGPGSSSMVGLFQEVGPCQVVEIAQGKLGTQAREWGWDRSSNMIFIDQPVQVGFSYDTLTNASLNLIDELTLYPPEAVPAPQPAYTFLNGTFGSGSSLSTANTSQLAAHSMWHFLQAFLGVFPQYNPANYTVDSATSTFVGVNLFAESYGGKYGPAIAAFFESQNALRLTDPVMFNSTLAIRLDSLGLINSFVDLYVQTPFYPLFAYNNTYNIQAISQVDELNALSAYSAANGCQQMTETCRALEASLDPQDTGGAASVDHACAQAELYCQTYVLGPYTLSGRSLYDISQSVLDPFPDSHYLEYLNTAAVQQAIGAPVNYTQDSQAVFNAFLATGDYARDGILNDLISLLNAGVRIALIYGDRDYVCNWLGGEAASFAIAGGAQPQYAPWYAAGYAPIVANSSYIGGVVREFGNLSFSRIYDAGHLVPAYQPETAFTVFSRIIEGTEIGLGSMINLGTYGSYGDANSTHQNVAPPMESPVCYLRAVNSTCDTDQKNMLANGAGVIINGVLYSDAADWTTPDANLSTLAGVPGTAPMSMYSSAPSPIPTNATRSTERGSGTTTGKAGQSTSGSAQGKTLGTSSLPTGVYTATGVPRLPTTTATTKSEGGRGGIASRDTQILAFGVVWLMGSMGVRWC